MLRLANHEHQLRLQAAALIWILQASPSQQKKKSGFVLTSMFGLKNRTFEIRKPPRE